jgi:hypothetical protein
MAVDHQATAVALVAIAVGLALASFVIEPATTRAAFGSRFSDPRPTSR